MSTHRVRSRARVRSCSARTAQARVRSDRHQPQAVARDWRALVRAVWPTAEARAGELRTDSPRCPTRTSRAADARRPVAPQQSQTSHSPRRCWWNGIHKDIRMQNVSVYTTMNMLVYCTEKLPEVRKKVKRSSKEKSLGISNAKSLN